MEESNLENTLSPLDIQEIMSLLPHTYPMLLVDRIVDYKVGEWIKGYKNITINEPQFPGHFPGKPIFPGVLILEAMAQTAGILGFKTGTDPTSLYLYAGIDSARFKRPVFPGDRLDFDVKLLRVRSGIWKFEGVASVDGQEACTATFMCAMRNV